MNVLKKLIVAATCSLVFGSAAHANVIPLAQIELSPNYQLNFDVAAKKSTTLTFDINALLAEESATLADIVSAILNVYLTDPNGGNNERYTIAITGQAVAPANQVNNGSGERVTFTFATAALNDLKADGIIDATVSARAGEFVLARATLDVNVEVEEAEVPEPASLALLGMGLLGLGAARRRRA